MAPAFCQQSLPAGMGGRRGHRQRLALLSPLHPLWALRPLCTSAESRPVDRVLGLRPSQLVTPEPVSKQLRATVSAILRSRGSAGNRSDSQAH